MIIQYNICRLNWQHFTFTLHCYQLWAWLYTV